MSSSENDDWLEDPAGHLHVYAGDFQGFTCLKMDAPASDLLQRGHPLAWKQLIALVEFDLKRRA